MKGAAEFMNCSSGRKKKGQKAGGCKRQKPKEGKGTRQEE